jgi:hypothetical protein
MDRKARAILFFAFAFIDFFLFSGVGLHVLGLVFLVYGIYLLATRPRAV